MAILKPAIICWLYKYVFGLVCTVLILAEGVESDVPDTYGIELAVGSSNLLPLEDGNTAIVNFVFSAKNKPSVEAFLDTNLKFPVSIDTKKGEGIVIIDSRYLQDLSTDFGAYLLTLVLSDGDRNYTKEMVLFYEEPIEDFSVTPTSFEHYPDQDIKLDVTLKRGSNVEIEWLFDHKNDSCLVEYYGPIRHVHNTLRFDKPGFYNVSVIAANEITRTYVSVPITVRPRPLTFLSRLLEAGTKNKKPSQPSFQAVTLNPRMAFKVK